MITITEDRDRTVTLAAETADELEIAYGMLSQANGGRGGYRRDLQVSTRVNRAESAKVHQLVDVYNVRARAVVAPVPPQAERGYKYRVLLPVTVEAAAMLGCDGGERMAFTGYGREWVYADRGTGDEENFELDGRLVRYAYYA